MSKFYIPRVVKNSLISFSGQSETYGNLQERHALERGDWDNST